MTAYREISIQYQPSGPAKNLSSIIGLICASLAVLMLLGYLFEIEWLYRPLPGGPATHPTTAICILFLGLSIFLISRRDAVIAALLLSLLVLVICAFRVLGIILEMDITEILNPFAELVKHELRTGKINAMGANTAVMLFGIAMAIFLKSRALDRSSQIVSFGAIAIPAVSLAGLAYGLVSFYGQMSFTTSLFGLTLGVAAILLTADKFALSIILGDNLAGKIARYQLLAALVIPFVFGGLMLSTVNDPQDAELIGIWVVGVSWFVILMVTFSAIWIDKSEFLRRQSELISRALRKSKIRDSQFRSLFQYSPIALLMVGSGGRVVTANEAALALFGYSSGDLVGMMVDELVPQASRAGHQALRENYLQDPKSRYMSEGRQLHAVDRNGNNIPVQIGLVPVETEKGSAVIAAISDMSELNSHIEALERSNRELDQFAYVASHDLRAPLNGIGHLVHAIEEDVAHLLPEEDKEFIQLIKSRVRRLDALLDSLLEYSRLGTLESRPAIIDTRQKITAMADLYLPPDRFRLDIAGDLPKLALPPALFDLIVRNLIMNSVKHHDREQGTIGVRAETRVSGEYLYFSDDGPGISPQYGEQIFEMFRTLRRRDEVEGSGMGLPLIRKAMLSLDGEISLVPNEGRGTTFELRFPSSAEAGMPADVIAGNREPGDGDPADLARQT